MDIPSLNGRLLGSLLVLYDRTLFVIVIILHTFFPNVLQSGFILKIPMQHDEQNSYFCGGSGCSKMEPNADDMCMEPHVQNRLYHCHTTTYRLDLTFMSTLTHK